jgi:hypothetical protein
MSNRIEKLTDAVEAAHKCKAVHRDSNIVIDLFRDKVSWDGVVEVFDLEGHPKAKRCYAWSYIAHNDVQYITVLELPPVDSAESAVRVAVAAGQQK